MSKAKAMKPTTLSKASVVAICGAIAVLAGACKQEVLCPALGECGGTVPFGTWALAPGYPSCIEDLYVPPDDPRLYGGEVPSARKEVIEPALWDWCDGLVTNAEKVRLKPPQFLYESGPIGRANLTFTQDDPSKPTEGHYTIGISRTGTYSLSFPAVCMREFGAMDLPGMPLCKRLEPIIAADALGEGSYPTLTCDVDPEDAGGCLCFFNVSETGGPSGHFQLLDGNTIMFLPGNNFPQKATYCNKGDSLELTGADGGYLFAQRGLRTLNLQHQTASCTDGAQNGDETGVDCGGACPACAAPP
jgi:hypothetical protein